MGSDGPKTGTVWVETTLPVHVMVRPRGGDFLYSSVELEVMRADIRALKAAGAHGIVLGVLTAVGINAWWGDRQDAAKEQTYLRQLAADLAETERIVAERDDLVKLLPSILVQDEELSSLTQDIALEAIYGDDYKPLEEGGFDADRLLAATQEAKVKQRLIDNTSHPANAGLKRSPKRTSMHRTDPPPPSAHTRKVSIP